MSEVAGIPGYTKDEIIHQVELNLWETWSNFRSVLCVAIMRNLIP